MKTATAVKGDESIKLMRLRETWGKFYRIDYLGNLYHAQRRAEGAKPFKAISCVVMLEMLFADDQAWRKAATATDTQGMIP
jgi:hypothetical protein